MTINLANNVQINKVQGTEAPLVQLAQQAYPKYNGWTNHGISQATQNVKDFIKSENPDIIGLQEVIYEYLDKIKDNYKMIGFGGVYFLYKESIFGDGILLSNQNTSIGDRGFILIWFPKINLLAINLHAPHRVILSDEIKKTLSTISIPSYCNFNRIIMTGDFNDAYHAPLSEIELYGMILKQPGPSKGTCCTDSNYIYKGDYIFDTEYETKGFYGVPDSVDKYKYKNTHHILMSDHYQVVYYQN